MLNKTPYNTERRWTGFSGFALFFLLLSVSTYGKPDTEELDLVAPNIDIVPIEEARPNRSLVISAKVQDNHSVKKVTLFYRSAKEKEFRNIEMSRGGKGDVYFASLEPSNVQSPSIAYYIQATDIAGNSVLYGYNFSPKLIRVHKGAKSNSSVKLGSLDGSAKKGKKTKKGAMKWLLIGLGAVAVGAAASSGGDSGSAPGAPGDDSDTGSVTIVAPVP